MKKYGLIGKTLGHSFSQKFFTEKFAREHTDAQYSNYEIPDAALLANIIMSDADICGLNVTIPYKQDVIPLMDGLSDAARAIGAVNVVKIERQQPYEAPGMLAETKIPGIRLTGHNTDVVGFVNSIRPLLRPNHKRALILGTGGASLAIDYGLRQLGIATQFVSRSGKNGAITYDDITAEVVKDHTVIVNCTPLGTFPNVDECAPIPYQLLTSDHLLYDLVYNPDETLFLRNGREQGAATKNGLEMLHLQAIAAWEIWNGEV